MSLGPGVPKQPFRYVARRGSGLAVVNGPPGPRFPKRLMAAPWLLVFLPVQAATTAFGVVLPLLILVALHAGVTEVALASTLYNSALIPAALLWGVICDRLQMRAPLLLINFAGFALLFFVLAQGAGLAELLVVYTAYGLVAPSSAAASNLLILERFTPEDRPVAFASFQELSTLGGVAGLVLGFFWLLVLPGTRGLFDFLYLAASLSAAGALGTALFIRDPPRRFARREILRHPESFAARLSSFIPFFPRRLKRPFLPRLRHWLREEATHEIPLVLAAVFLFNVASNLFNTSYIPYLRVAGLTSAGIFLVNLSNSGAQAVVYPFSGTACERDGGERAVVAATGVRAVGYAATAGLAFVPAGLLLAGGALSANLLIFGLLGGAVALYGTSSSLLLFRSVRRQGAGGLLGFSSALGGMAAVLGAALSGVLSAHFGFGVTFTLSLLVMAASVPVWHAARNAWRSHHARPEQKGS